ncbi:MAG: DUF3618 domain-containing protein [Gemmatimonadaceae bacterium]
MIPTPEGQMAGDSNSSRVDDEGRFGDSANAPSADSGQEHPNAIRAEISDTRDRMSTTLDAIGERLNPHHVKEQVTEQVKESIDHVKDSIRGATIGRVEDMAHQAADRVNETKRGIVDMVRENPIPAAMVGIGLGWMMLNSGSSDSNDVSQRYASADRSLRNRSMQQGSGRGYGGSSYGGSYASGSGSSGYADSHGSRGQGGSGSGSSGFDSDVSGMTDSIRDKASDIGGSVKNAAGDMTDSVKGAAGDLADRAQDVAGSVAQGTRVGARKVEDAFHDNPLLTGAVTLALGLAAGLAAPRTHTEVQLMGDARDQFGDRMRHVAQDTKHKAENVAERVIDETKNAVKQEGMPSKQ